MTKQKNHFLSLISSLIILISTLILTIIGVIYGTGSGQPGGSISGIAFFRPFTMDSNILMAVIAAIIAIYDLKCIINPQYIAPKWLGTLRLIGTATISITIIVVILALTPIQATKGNSPILLYSGDMFFFHVLNPLLAIIGFILFQPPQTYLPLSKMLAFLPTVIYCMVYGLMVFVFKTWNDFYGFTFGGQIAFGILAVILLLALLFGVIQSLTFANKKFSLVPTK